MTVPGIGTFTPRQNMVSVGADATLRATLLEIVNATAASAPRSKQRAMGPSEIGDPCTRKLAYKISGHPEPASSESWWSVLGTSFHAWMAEGLKEQNELCVAAGYSPRWLIEERVQVRPGLSGSLDAYDLWTDTVVDHKLLGKSSHDDMRINGPYAGYEVQVNAYGVGLANKGYTPKRVAIAAYPRFTEVSKGLHVWSDDFHPEVAYAALQRLDKIKEAVHTVNPITKPENFKLFKSVPSSKCSWCPWLLPGEDTGAACPGNLK